jgi:protoporphyrinogen oxidase
MHIAVIGAGPAGLSAAYDLVHAGHQVTVYEQDARFVGGISRTVEYQGYRFDIGGHRFFTKNPEIESYWHAMLGDDLLHCRRLSRIFYGGKFFNYPLNAGNAFRNLGLLNTAMCLADYMKIRAFPHTPVRTFEDWVTNQFGTRLYTMFFQTYTEKVWGMPCNEISADWAAQRIQGLNLARAAKAALFPHWRPRRSVIKTLADTFLYPRLGPGMLWERVAGHIRERGGTLLMGTKVSGIAWKPGTGITEIHTTDHRVSAPDQVISSMPMRSLVRALNPRAPRAVQSAAEALQYRDFITVALIVDAAEVFPDHWIYIHDPQVKVGRIQNFKTGVVTWCQTPQ